MYGGGTCWDGSTMNTGSGSYCPPMPTTKETCTANAGKVYWCENSGSGWSNGWCSMMPCNKDQCTAAGKYWCDNSAGGSGTSGWCGDMKCAPMGKMICPDGDTFVDSLKNCPRKGSEPTMKDCPDGTKVPTSSVCPEQKKTCSDGSIISGTAPCPTDTTLTCPGGAKVKALEECPTADFKTCPDGKKVLKTVDCHKQEKKMCPDGKTEKVEGKECPLTESDLKKMKELKEEYLKRLEELATFFKNAGDATSFDKIGKLKASLDTLPLTTAGLDILDSVETDIRLLNEEKK